MEAITVTPMSKFSPSLQGLTAWVRICLDFWSRINQIKPVWIELGLQTIHPETAVYIPQGVCSLLFEDAVHPGCELLESW